jgi:hypothetical protein
MQRPSRARIGFVALVLGCVVLGPSVAARDDVILAKLGLDWLSKEQQQQLWKRVELYADMESFANFCGRPSQIERRVINAVKPCITPVSLQQVIAHFRKKLTEKNGTITADRSICEEQRIKNLVREIHTTIDKLVTEVTQMCKSCIIC